MQAQIARTSQNFTLALFFIFSRLSFLIFAFFFLKRVLHTFEYNDESMNIFQSEREKDGRSFVYMYKIYICICVCVCVLFAIWP